MCEKHQVQFQSVCGEDTCGMCFAEELAKPQPVRVKPSPEAEKANREWFGAVFTAKWRAENPE